MLEAICMSKYAIYANSTLDWQIIPAYTSSEAQISNMAGWMINGSTQDRDQLKKWWMNHQNKQYKKYKKKFA